MKNWRKIYSKIKKIRKLRGKFEEIFESFEQNLVENLRKISQKFKKNRSKFQQNSRKTWRNFGRKFEKNWRKIKKIKKKNWKRKTWIKLQENLKKKLEENLANKKGKIRQVCKCIDFHYSEYQNSCLHQLWKEKSKEDRKYRIIFRVGVPG